MNKSIYDMTNLKHCIEIAKVYIVFTHGNVKMTDFEDGTYQLQLINNIRKPSLGVMSVYLEFPEKHEMYKVVYSAARKDYNVFEYQVKNAITNIKEWK